MALITWDSGGDGSSWNDAANWSGDVLPGAADDVLIDVAEDISVRIPAATGNVEVNSLDVRETLSVDSVTLTVNGPSNVDTLVLNHTTVDGPGDLTIHGGSLSRPRFNGSGRLTIAPGAIVNATGVQAGFVRATNNFGTLQVTSSSVVLGGDFVNEVGGTVVFSTASGARATVGRVSSGFAPKFINRGTIRKTGDGQLGFSFNVLVDNQGEFDLVAGTVSIDGGGSSTTTIDVPASTTLVLAKDFSFSAATAVSGTGRLELRSGSYDFGSAQFAFAGALELVIASVVFGDVLPDGLTLETISSSTLSFDAAQSFDSLSASGSTFKGPGDIVLDGTSSLERVTFDGTGSLTISAGATVAASGSSAGFVRATRNFGTLQVTTRSVVLGRDFVNEAGGTILFSTASGTRATVGRVSSGVTPRLVNQGTIRKVGAGELAFNFGVVLDNEGELALTAGTISVDGGGSSTTTIDVPAETTLILRKTFVSAAATLFTGTGRLELRTGTYDLSSTHFAFAGTLQLASATVVFGNAFPAGMALEPVSSSNVTFNVAQTLSSLSASGSTFKGPGDLVLDGTSSVDRTIFEGTGRLTIAAGATVQTSGNSHVVFDRDTQNFGTIHIGSAFLSLGKDLINRSGGTISASPAAGKVIRILSTSGSLPHRIVNEGRILKTGDGTLSIGFSVLLDNQSELDLTAGTTSIEGGGSSATAIHVPSAATLILRKDYAFPGATALTGTGRLEIRSGTYDFSSSQFAFAGTLQLGGTVIFGNAFPAGMTLEPISRATVTFNVAQTLNSLSASSSTFKGAGAIVLDGTSSVDRVTFEGTGSLTIASGATLNTTGSTAVTLGRTTENFGTLNVGSSLLVLDRELINRAGGTITASPAAGRETLIVPASSSSTPKIINEGKILKTGEGKLRTSVPLDNRNSVELAAGTLTTGSFAPSDTSGIFSIATGATLDPPSPFVLQGGRLEGSGTLLADLVNSGIVAPGSPIGTLTIAGDYTQQPDGTLDIAVNASADDHRSRLAVSGTAALDGMLIGRFVDGFVPADNQLFSNVLTASAVNGSFSKTSFLGVPGGSSIEVEVVPSSASMRVHYPNADEVRAVRDQLNAGLTAAKARGEEFAAKFSMDAGGLPFVSGSAGALAQLVGIPSALAEFNSERLKIVTADTTTFEALRAALETAGYEVTCTVGEEACGTDRIRVRVTGSKPLTHAEVGLDDLAGTPLGALAAQTTLAGGAAFDSMLEIDREFGVDTRGFYSGADSVIVVPTSATVAMSGQFDLFALSAAAELNIRPRIHFRQLDVDGDGKVYENEIVSNLPVLEADISAPVVADLTLDATLNFLDFYDVDVTLPNRAHGGDPFIIRAAASLIAHPDQFNPADFSGLETRWHSLRAANPDIDNDGQPDYTEAVFLYNALRLGRDLLNGTGVFDYFGSVLGIENAVPGRVGQDPVELRGTKLPSNPRPLANEVAATEIINGVLVEILAERPPTDAELQEQQRLVLRDWFFADADDKDATTGQVLPEKESIQFRLAKIAPVAGKQVIAGELRELVSPIDDDQLFERLFIEALTDWIRWNEEVSYYGYHPAQLVAALPGESSDPIGVGRARLRSAEDAIIEGFREIVQRAADRAAAAIDAEGHADVPALLEGAQNAIDWSIEAARLGSLVSSSEPGSFDERAGIELADVIGRLPFVIRLVEKPTLSGEAADATLSTRAAIFIKRPGGGFFSTPIFHPSIPVTLSPGSPLAAVPLEGATETVGDTNPDISRSQGTVDVSGNFSSQVAIGATDQDISVVVTTGLDPDAPFDQQDASLKGPIRIDLTAEFPLGSDVDATTGSGGSFVVPNAARLKLSAALKRGNRALTDRPVVFFLSGAGALSETDSRSDLNGVAHAVYFAPPNGSGTTTVGVAYFEQGRLFTDVIQVEYEPTAEFSRRQQTILPVDFSDLFPSPNELAVAAAIQELLDANPTIRSPVDLSSEDKAAVIPQLRNWFNQEVAPKVALGLTSDSLLIGGIRELFGWQSYVARLGLAETDVVTAAQILATERQRLAGVKNAIDRERNVVFDDQDRLRPSAQDLGPLFAALRWSATAAKVGIDVKEESIAFEDVLGTFQISSSLSNVELTGVGNSAQIRGDAAILIGGQVPPFDVPLRVTLAPQGTSSVGQVEFDFNKSGSFQTTAVVGGKDGVLEVDVELHIGELLLATERRTLESAAHFQLEAFAGSDEAKQSRKLLRVGATEPVMMHVDVLRGATPIREGVVAVQVIGRGSVSQASFRPGDVTNLQFVPPTGLVDGRSVVRFSFPDGSHGEITDEVTIEYSASRVDDAGSTPDAVFAANQTAEILSRSVPEAERRSALEATMRNWFRGVTDRADLKSVTQRLQEVQLPNGPPDYFEFRQQLLTAVGDFVHWETQISVLGLDGPAAVLAGDPLPGMTGDQEYTQVRSLIASGLRDVIVRQDSIVTASGFDFLQMLSAEREILDILASAAFLGIDSTEDGLNVNDAIRNSLAFPTADHEAAMVAIQEATIRHEPIVIRSATGQTEFVESFLAELRPILKSWFFSNDPQDVTVISQLEELQSGSSGAPSDYDVFANRLKKAIRNWTAWRQTAARFKLVPAEVLGPLSGKLQDAESLVIGGLNEAVRRVVADANTLIASMPANPSRAELAELLLQATRAREWHELAATFELDRVGSGLDEAAVAARLPFEAVLNHAATGIKTRDETVSRQPELHAVALLRIDGRSQTLATDLIGIELAPRDGNSATLTSAKVSAADGTFETTLTLGPTASAFRYDVAATIEGLQFARTLVERSAIASIELAGALLEAGETTLRSGSASAIDGQPLRLRARVMQGNQRFAGAAVFMTLIGPGAVDYASALTGSDGVAEFVFTPPADQIGRTKVIATVFQEARVLQAEFDVDFTSTQVDATVVPPRSAEQVAAIRALQPILQRAALDSILGTPHDDLKAELVPPMRTWYLEGVVPRIGAALDDPAKLEEAATEYLIWLGEAAAMGIDLPAGEEPYLSAEVEEAQELMTNSVQSLIDSHVRQATQNRDGEAAITAITIAEFATVNVLVDSNDASYSLGAVLDRLKFKIVVDRSFIDDGLTDAQRLAGEKAPPGGLFEAVVQAHVELNGVPTATVPALPVDVLPLGFAFAGLTSGKLRDGEFRVPIIYGKGDRTLRAQLTLGEGIYAKTVFIEIDGPLELVTIASLGAPVPDGNSSLAVGRGQSAKVGVQIRQGLGTVSDHRAHYKIQGQGSLSLVADDSDGNGISAIEFTPPDSGSGTTTIQIFVQGKQGVEMREVEVEWDASREPIVPPDPGPEAGGLFNHRAADGQLNGASVPGTGVGAGDQTGLTDQPFEISVEQIEAIIAGRGSLGNWREKSLNLLELIDFNTLVHYFEDGFPAEPAELIRLEFDFASNSVPDRALFSSGFSEVLPPGVDAQVSLLGPQLNGSLIFGLDTSPSPFYVLTQSDDLSPATTPIEVAYGLDARLEAETPLIGTPDQPILSIDEGFLQLDTSFVIDPTAIAREPALQGKLRFDNLDELAKLRVGFNEDPFDRLQAVVGMTLTIPGIKESRASSRDARIPLVAGVSRIDADSPFRFELASGGIPELPDAIRDGLVNITLTTDDEITAAEATVLASLEENDSPEQVAARDLFGVADKPSPNLGVRQELLTLTTLSLKDEADWFRFETTEIGNALSFVRVDFDSRRGDLDLALFRELPDGSLQRVATDVGGGDDATISLVGMPAGVYFVQVYDDLGGRQPHYAFRYNPPQAAAPGLDLALGTIELQDLRLAGSLDTNGDFQVDVSGTLLIPEFQKSDGSAIPIGVGGSINNDELTLSGSIDLTGETLSFGDSPRLLEVSDLFTQVDVTIPLDGSEVTGGITVRAGGAVITPDFAVRAVVSGDKSNPDVPIPGLAGAIDFATGTIDLDLYRVQFDLADIVEIDALPDPGGNSAVRFSYDATAAGADDLIVFEQLVASLPALVAEGAVPPSVTLRDFGFRHDGQLFLGGLDLAIPADVLESLGLPPILDITRIGVDSFDGGRLTGSQLENLDFKIAIDAKLDLTDEGIPVSASVGNLEIDMRTFDGGNLLNGITFDSVAVDFGTREDPIQLGALTFFGGFLLERFDPTPEIADDDPSMIVRVDVAADFAGIGLAGEILFTEYGPISAGLGVAFSEAGIPLGPVALYEARALVLFNEQVPDLPLRDPLKLIEGVEEGDTTFDLSRFRYGSDEALRQATLEKARQFIRDNRQRSTPIATWNTPFVIAISGLFGPVGQTRSAAAFLADVTIGANVDPQPSAPEVVVFGLGEAFVPDGSTPDPNDRLSIGVVGAVLELSDPLNPTFQFAFATPSPGSDLSDKIPAEVRLGATLIKEGNDIRLDIVGDVNVMDVLTAEASGSLRINDAGLFGQIEIVIGAGTGGEGAGDPVLDLDRFGADFALSGKFELMFNFTDRLQTITRPDRRDPDTDVSIDVPAATTRLYVSGVMDAGGFEVEGAFLMQVDAAGLQVGAIGTLAFGALGKMNVRGGLLLVAEERNASGGVTRAAGVAGKLEVVSNFAIPGLLTLDGSITLGVNSFGAARSVLIPSGFDGGTEMISVAPGFLLRISGSDPNDPGSLAKLSIFPADAAGNRLVGLDFFGRFDIAAQPNRFALSFAAGADVIFNNNVVLGADVAADLAFETILIGGERRDVVSGGFSGSVRAGSAELLHVEGELDPFGCLRTNIPLLEELPPFSPACTQRIYVPHQQFSESSGETALRVELTSPAKDELTVTVESASVGPDGAAAGRDYTLDGSITVPAGTQTILVPLTVIDDEVVETNRQFHVTVRGKYPGKPGIFRPADPLFENIQGDITIVDDDAPPIGPPVTVRVTPSSNLTLTSSIEPGEPITAQLTEADGPIAFEFVAPELQRQDEVTLRVRLVRAEGNERLTRDFVDVTPAFGERTVTLRGRQPATVSFLQVDDDTLELPEQVRVDIAIVKPAGFAPSTSLANAEAAVRVLNDDPERPETTLLFYSFDGDATPVPGPDGSPTGADYAFTNAATFAADRIVGSPLIHVTDSSIAASGLPKLDPGALFDPETPAAGSDEWSVGTTARQLLVNPVADEGLAGWFRASGSWSAHPSTRAFSGAAVFESEASSITGARHVLEQRVSLASIRRRLFLGHQQPFDLQGVIQPRLSGSSGRIEVEFFDPGNRSLGRFSSTAAVDSDVWNRTGTRGTVPNSASFAVVRLVALAPFDRSLAPVLFDGLSLSFPDPPYFEFSVGLDDLERPLETPDDFDRALGIRIDGIELWESAGTTGPRGWELRSSQDGFAHSLAGAATSRDGFQLNRQSLSFGEQALRPITQPLVFRIYALNSEGGRWSVDNVAVTGEVRPLSSFPQKPVAKDDSFSLVGDQIRNGVVLGVLDNDFDPNGAGMKIVGLETTPHGRVELAGGSTPSEGFRIRYTPNDPDFTGAVKFRYTITEHAARSDGFSSATVTLNIVDLTARADAYTAVSGTTLLVPAADGVLSNDELFGLSVQSVIVGGGPNAGTLSMNADGSFAYVPDAETVTDSFSYFFVTTSGLASRSTTVRLTVVPDASRQAVDDDYVIREDERLVAVAGAVQVLSESGEPVRTFPDVLANDIRGVGPPLVAKLVAGSEKGTFLLKEDGRFDYTPPANFSGVVQFQYRIGKSSSDPIGTATIRVIPVNDAPVADSKTVAIFSGRTAPVDIQVTGTDVDSDNQDLRIINFTQPALGRVDVVHTEPRTFRYQPPEGGLSKRTNFSFQLTDGGTRGLSRFATVTLVPLVIPGQGGSRLSPLGGSGFNGEIAGAEVFLDSDGNAVNLAELAALASSEFRTNVANIYDINDDGVLTPRDALLVIDKLTQDASVSSSAGSKRFYFDVDGNLRITPRDVLLVIEALLDPELARQTLFSARDRIGPNVTTSPSGSFVLPIPDEIDANGDGRQGSDEGRLVLRGGTVSSTRLRTALPLTAPGDATVISAITTLLVSLTDDFGLSLKEASDTIRDGLSLPEFDMLHSHVLREALQGDVNGPLIYRASIQVIDTATMLAHYLAKRLGRPLEELTPVSFGAIANQLRLQSGTRLGDARDLRRILQWGETASGLVADEAHTPAWIATLAASNRLIDAVPAIGGVGFLESLARIETVLQGTTIVEFLETLSGRLDADEFIRRNTGTELRARVAGVQVGNVVAPRITVSDVEIVDPPLGQPTEAIFVVRLDRPSREPVQVRFATADGTLLSGNGDYVTHDGTLTFAAGETEREVAVEITSLGVATGGTLELILSDATGAVFTNRFAKASVVPADRGGEGEGTRDSLDWIDSSLDWADVADQVFRDW